MKFNDVNFEIGDTLQAIGSFGEKEKVILADVEVEEYSDGILYGTDSRGDVFELTENDSKVIDCQNSMCYTYEEKLKFLGEFKKNLSINENYHLKNLFSEYEEIEHIIDFGDVSVKEEVHPNA